MGKWKSVALPPDVIANRLLAEEQKAAAAAKGSQGTADASTTKENSTSSSTSTQSLPFQMPAIHFHTGTLMNGTGGYMASPSKQTQAARRPRTSDVTPSVLGDISAKSFQTIREFLAAVDQEEAEGGESSNYSQYADQFIAKGYRRIHLLYDETPRSLQVDLELPISMGDAKQLLMHVKCACQKVARNL